MSKNAKSSGCSVRMPWDFNAKGIGRRDARKTNPFLLCVFAAYALCVNPTCYEFLQHPPHALCMCRFRQQLPNSFDLEGKNNVRGNLTQRGQHKAALVRAWV